MALSSRALGVVLQPPFQALRRYCMLVADNGSSWFISGATDSSWDDDDVGQLKDVPGSAFEVVRSGS